ncbi:hypothetical protein ACSBR2_039442 [Camellia fascicularis]
MRYLGILVGNFNLLKSSLIPSENVSQCKEVIVTEISGMFLWSIGKGKRLLTLLIVPLKFKVRDKVMGFGCLK